MKTQTVSEVEVENSVDAFNALILSDCYTSGPRLANRDGFLVDDEGLLTLTDESKFFMFDGYPNPLAGNGLLLGCTPSGNTVNVKSTVDSIKKSVKFLTLAQVREGIACGAIRA